MATLVTAKGREIICNMMKATGTEPKVVGWGTNPKPTTATVSDVAAFMEASEARVSGTSSVVTTTTTNDTYQVTGTITASGAKTIAEVTLTDGTTKPFSTTWATAPTTTSGTTGTATASYTPANNTHIQNANGEVMTVTAGTGTTSLTVVRGANGSTAATVTNGDTFQAGDIPSETTIGAGGNLYLHGDFTGLALANGDSIAFTIQVKHT